ncbi:MAG: GtrA family protein [Oscillospiraceae bacterium]|nr:GtrA family protein [Oscillospiraceae bacterium]
MDKIKELCIKHREILVYIIVGGLTTVVAWGCKFLWNAVFYAGTALPTVTQNTVLSVVENVSGIAFAYPTNRKWVFQSKNPNILSELLSFVGSRAATWILGWLLNMLLVNVLNVSVFVSTVVVGILVIIGNYVFSKLLVFRKKNVE